MQRIALVFLSALLIFWAFPPSSAANRLRKFYIGPVPTNRTTAKEECRKNYTDLVTVYNHQDNMELAGLISKHNYNAWIGAYKGNYSMKSSNGDDVTFYRNVTVDCEKTCCAAMKADGKLDFLQCSEKKNFMCYEQESYNYSLIRENKTWFEAQLYCRENHTDLVTIRNYEVNERVKEAGNGSNSFWIGLLVDSVEWADGGQSAYRNWMSLSDQKPLIFMDFTGKWQTNTQADTNPLCYKSFIHVSTWENRTWEEALDYCHENGKELLTIQSQNDQKEIEQKLKGRNISEPLWVGLRQSRLFGFWIWTNGLRVGPWTNWKGGNPPEHLLSHHCGAIEEVNGQYKWTDKDCRSELGVLCEG